MKGGGNAVVMIGTHRAPHSLLSAFAVAVAVAGAPGIASEVPLCPYGGFQLRRDVVRVGPQQASANRIYLGTNYALIAHGVESVVGSGCLGGRISYEPHGRRVAVAGDVYRCGSAFVVHLEATLVRCMRLRGRLRNGTSKPQHFVADRLPDRCGNGVLEDGEECDGDGCPSGQQCRECRCEMPAGRPDPSFGAGGEVITALGPNDRVRTLAVAPDGSVIVAATVVPDRRQAVGLFRFTASGHLHPGFGHRGRVVTLVGAGDADAFALVRTSDGSLLVGTRPAAVIRYRSNGSPGDDWISPSRCQGLSSIGTMRISARTRRSAATAHRPRTPGLCFLSASGPIWRVASL